MNKLESARDCRSYAEIFPQLAGHLQTLELRFLRDATREEAGLAAQKRSLDVRRLEVGHWPDLLAQLQENARKHELGLETDLAGLSRDLDALVKAFENTEAQDAPGGDIGRLRQSAAMLDTHATTGMQNLANWTALLGARDPRKWSPKLLRRVLRRILRSSNYNHHRLDEILLMEFLSRSQSYWGNLGWLLTISSKNEESPFAWQGYVSENQHIRDVISRELETCAAASRTLLTVLLDYPHIWRDLRVKDRIAEASIRAVIAIINACLAPIHEHIIFPEDHKVMIRMSEAVRDFESYTETMLQEIATHFPNRVDTSPDRSGKGDLLLGMINPFHGYADIISLHPPRKLGWYLRVIWPARDKPFGYGKTPREISYLQEIFHITPQTRAIGIGRKIAALPCENSETRSPQTRSAPAA